MKVEGPRSWRSGTVAALRDQQAAPATSVVEVNLDHRITITAPLGASTDELYEAVRQADRLRQGLLHPNRDQRADRMGEYVARIRDIEGHGRVSERYWTHKRIADMLDEDQRTVERWEARWRRKENRHKSP